MNSELLFQVFGQLFTFQVLFAITMGVIGGIIVGSLPGLSATMAIALMIPVTFGMDPIAGLTMLTAIYTGAIYGGSISAILIHTPGTPSSAATSLDGYQLTLKGKGAKALGVSTISSMIGGFISAIALLFLAPPLSRISLMFSAPEYFLIAVFGLTIIGGLATKSMVKGLAGGVIGLLIGTIGMDILTGYSRFTFDFVSLQSGVPIIPAMIGLFSLSQVMIQAEKLGRKDTSKIVSKVKGKVLLTLKEFKQIWVTIIRSSGIGTFVGMLPGAGADIGSWVGYNEAKRFSKNKEEFGKGSIEGVAASEAANNAVTGGSLIPLLTLGIPGNVATAVFLGGLMIQGLVPGRELFTTHANITYSVIIGFVLANILMGIVGLLGARYLVKISEISVSILAPLIIGFSVVGSYAISNNIFDIWVMIVFGFIGYFIRKTGFHPAPIILGMILGPIGEQGFRQSLVMAKGDLLPYFFSRPISIVLILLIVITLFSPLIMKWWKNRKTNNLKQV
ncbi:tripartite tricarboxylate transporter permease [Halalkalibacter alkaliphilus]|uniref:Tripartite tricarboxylate transporter permease n=1 Tax=Halalkalibacter alkaliphilus TaxID=2917993 RepID=A0A9X2CV56_9BACI|nr:tripartite tricarboxylate transporter permease [Halalkalibacter alkaliphilus]MCL7748843.1 tripartite tricarboxylate transporter permease [Halalkalibacter alkaliphilus]